MKFLAPAKKICEVSLLGAVLVECYCWKILSCHHRFILKDFPGQGTWLLHRYFKSGIGSTIKSEHGLIWDLISPKITLGKMFLVLLILNIIELYCLSLVFKAFFNLFDDLIPSLIVTEHGLTTSDLKLAFQKFMCYTYSLGLN